MGLTFESEYEYAIAPTAIRATTAVKNEEEKKAMSMNLAKQTFRTDPEYFIAGTTVRITTAVKEAGEPLEAHMPVKLDKGILTPVISTNGTVATEGIYGLTADSAAKNEDVVVYLTGEFFADGLALPDGVTAADVEVPLRNIGIFLK